MYENKISAGLSEVRRFIPKDGFAAVGKMMNELGR